MRLHKITPLRRILLPILKRLNPGDITIKHHYTGKKIHLHSFRHKGYWYHGANREKDTMHFFQRIISQGDIIFEIGGHIGYITQFFSDLAGVSGKVIVFEPGTNNLSYLTKNTEFLQNVQVVPKAVSNEDGEVDFFLDDLTGQNNSLLSDYDVREANQSNAFVESQVSKTTVETVKIDTFIRSTGVIPTFIKIDIEGAELLALEGMKDCLEEHKPALMIEVTAQEENVFNLLKSLGYVLFRPNGEIVSAPSLRGNTFCLQPHKHQQNLQS